MAAAFGFTVDVRSNVADVLRAVDDLQRNKVPFYTAYALTKTAQDVRAAQYASMREVFDRPTRFTLNSLFVRPATKHNLTAIVFFKEGFGSVPAFRYLGPQVVGGARVKKSHERALERAGILKSGEFVVPGEGVKLDAHGNMRGGDITRILSMLGASPDPTQNTTARSRRTRKGRARGSYFVLRDRGAPDGIYHRSGLREIKPVMIFVRRPQYRKRLPWEQTARRVVQQRFAHHFREGVRRFPPRRARRLAA
ncbi:MAG: hypothetical protein WD118_08810 [Phycisphaeraceae bacterium]